MTYKTLEEAFAATAKRLDGVFVNSWAWPNGAITARFKMRDGSKTFRPYRPADGNGEGDGWADGDPPGPWPLYRRDELKKFPDELVFLVEGEAKADLLASVGLLSIASAHGANGAAKTDWTPLAGRKLIALHDNDSAGRKYAEAVAAIVTTLDPPAVVKIVTLPGLPPKGDIVDWVAADGTMGDRTPEEIKAAILELAAKAPAAAPATGTKAPGGQTADAPVNTPALADAILATEAFAVDAGGKLWRYRGGVYDRDGVRHIARMTKAILARHGQADKWTTYRTKEVAAYIAADAPELWERPPLDRVNLLNGLLDVATRTLHPHTPEFLSPVQLPVAYDPAAACPAWERFCGEVFPPDCADYLPWELAAWLMLPITDIQKAVLLLGDGANGKSTFLAALTRFLGRENVAARTLHALEANRFATAGLVGKLANVAADLPARHLTDTGTFKALTGTEFAIPAEYKHGAQFDFPCFARLVFSANHPPTAGDASEAFFRRWVVVPFARVFEGATAKPRAHLDAELADSCELSGVLNRALAALPGVLVRGITESPSMRAAWGELRQATDPISVFLDACTITAPDALVTKADLLVAYNADARQNGRALASATAFGLAVKRAWPDLAEAQRTVGGRLQWCWLGLGIKAAEDRK